MVKHDNGLEETFKTTEEHPFYIDGQGWRKASILEHGMKMLDKDGNASATIISQEKLEETDTVYNFEVQDFHTYHIGEIGLWVHNDECCELGVKEGYSANTPILKDTPHNPNHVNSRVGETKFLFNAIRKSRVEIDGKYVKMDVDLTPTLNRIKNNDTSPFPDNDGIPYHNRNSKLPRGTTYTEWTVPTKGYQGRKSQRIVVGADGTKYYSPDHYKSFIKIKDKD